MAVKKPYDQPNSLLSKTIALLKERELVDVHVETKIPFYWLRQLRSGSPSQNPSVNRVQFLYEYLSDRKLFNQE